MLTVDTAAAVAGSHTVAIPGSGWRMWRSVCVRGAGFPAAILDDLAAPSAARAADVWIRAGQRVAARDVERKAARRAARASAQDHATDATARAAAAEAAWREAIAEQAAARAALDTAFASDAAQTTANLRRLAAEPRFREAVLWQNRRAVHTAFEPLLRANGSRPPSDRAVKERLVANYLQRYCVKNDTIGFFGPVAWARVVDDGPAVRVVPGERSIAARSVHFEGWAIDALARTMEARPGLRAWVAPRLLAQVRVEGTQLFIPGRAPVTIGIPHARLLRLCDGQRTPRRIARELASDPVNGVVREGDIDSLLQAFVQMGLVIWSLELPLERDPERALRARLAQIDDPAVRVPCVALLDQLDAARAVVAGSAGDPAALDRALASLEATFTRLTGAAATRSPGETYAARTLVYEECRRDATIEFGPPLIERISAPLSLLLDSARWCTSEVEQRYRLSFEAIARRLAGPSGVGCVDLSAVFAEGFDLGRKGEVPAPMLHIGAELRRRWHAILSPPAGARRVQYVSSDLRDGVAAAFGDASPGWTWARHVSPDLMIAADGLDAIERGEFVPVLGELHLMNSVVQTALAAEHPDPAELRRGLDADFPAATAVPVQSRETFTDRTAMGVRPSRAFWYESSREMAPGPRASVLRTADLVVEAAADGVWVAARDGRARFDAIDFLGYFLALKCVSTFGLLPDAAHTPRVTIDGVVVSRERWQVAATALEWAAAPSSVERFAGARRWAQALGIPRHAFVKVPVERKPFYLDLDSPVYVDIFAKLARKTANSAPDAPLALSEMLPAPHQLWLTDREGRRFTSELRLVMVDRRTPRRAARSGVPA
jgi:hypothetical protein